MTLPILHTARLSLRPLEETDDRFIYSLRSNQQVNTYLDRQPPTQIEEARAFIKKISDSIADNKSYYWGIALKESDSMIGTICLWNLSEDRKTAELGYELHPDFQGKGYMNEAIGEVIAYVCFKMALSRSKPFRTNTMLLPLNSYRNMGLCCRKTGKIRRMRIT